MGVDAGEAILGERSVAVRLEIQHGIGPDLLEGREIDLIGLQELAQGAFLDGGIGLDLRRIRMEDDIPVPL